MSDAPTFDLQHEWRNDDRRLVSHNIRVVFCRRCGIIQRADGRNKPCPGLVNVELR